MLKDDAYRYLADMVFKGFVTLHAVIGGKRFIFKTLNDTELDLVKLYSGPDTAVNYSSMLNTNYMVFSVFMVDFNNVLQNREEHYHELFDFFYGLPRALYAKILKELSDFKEIIYELSPYSEGFSFTDYARKKWNYYKGECPNKACYTGIMGTDKIGLNLFQEYWIYVNSSVDKENDFNRQFNLSLMVASSMNSKGTKKIGAKHDADMEAVYEKRKKIAVEGRLDKESKWKPDGWAAPVDSAEEIVEELNRQMEGKKDKHDLFVDDYIRRLYEAEDEKEAEQNRIMEESRERHKGMPSIMGGQRTMTPQEVEKMMERTKNSNNLVIVSSDEVAKGQDSDKFFRKIGNRVIKAKE